MIVSIVKTARKYSPNDCTSDLQNNLCLRVVFQAAVEMNSMAYNEGAIVSENQRWTAAHKAAAVLDIIRDKISLVDFCRANDLNQSEVEKWVDDFIKSGTQGLQSHPEELPSEHSEHICELKIGWRCRGSLFTGSPRKGANTNSTNSL
jgi:transposase-like protein